MQSQISMNIKQKIIRFARVFTVVLSTFLTYSSVNAQCNITTGGVPCVGEPVLFKCNTVGASNFNWDFNGEGSNTALCDPTFTFNTPGNKVIKLTLRLPNGSTCNTQTTINVKPKPIINVKRIESWAIKTREEHIDNQ